MEAETEVGAADHPWIILGLEPPGAQVHAAGRQTGKPALELHTPGAVASNEDGQIGESAASSTGTAAALNRRTSGSGGSQFAALTAA